MARESQFQSTLIKDIKKAFPGAIVLKNDPNYIQGFPDLLILYEDCWAALECKANASASHRPNQDYFVEILNEMSYATFVYPENVSEVMDELQHAFRVRRSTRIS